MPFATSAAPFSLKGEEGGGAWAPPQLGPGLGCLQPSALLPFLLFTLRTGLECPLEGAHISWEIQEKEPEASRVNVYWGLSGKGWDRGNISSNHQLLQKKTYI